MTASPERLAANQANAQKSTGPKTDAGKDISKRNALKHGLTGEGLALPDEDAAEVEASFQRQMAQMRPRTDLGANLVFRVALMTLRLRRFAEAEAASLSERVANAGAVFDANQARERDDAFSRIVKEPATQLARLASFPEGVDQLIRTWTFLKERLTADNWDDRPSDLFEALLGRLASQLCPDELRAWNLAAYDPETALDDERIPGQDAEAKSRWAIVQLHKVIDGQIARWRNHRAGLDLAPFAHARAAAIRMARYDGSPEAVLAKKYEAATSRELYKASRNSAWSRPRPPSRNPPPKPTNRTRLATSWVRFCRRRRPLPKPPGWRRSGSSRPSRTPNPTVPRPIRLRSRRSKPARSAGTDRPSSAVLWQPEARPADHAPGARRSQNPGGMLTSS